VGQALAEARADTRFVILSSEGLFHRWWDFHEKGLEALRWLAGQFPLELWVFFRDPVSFARSFYIQTLKNPRGFGPCYGEDLTLTDMLRNPRFAVHFDYMGYVRQVQEQLGQASVRPFLYDGDTVAAVLDALGIQGLEPPAARENRSVGTLGVSMLRAINQRALTFEAKADAVRLVEQLDRLVDDYSRPFVPDPEDVGMIKTLSEPGLAALRREYGIAIDIDFKV
jgi:hypothetical protein